MVGRIKTCFLLKNVHVQKLITRYNLSPNESEFLPTESTSIQDISKGGAFFLDDAKSTHNIKFHSINISGKNLNALNCYWDRNPTNGGFGCPIEFVFSEKLKDMDKGFYSLKKIGNTEKKEIMETPKQEMENQGIQSYYITDGHFCSLNCMIKFISEKSTDPLYKKSKMLLHKMKRELFDNISDIIPAPDWRELKEYGGKMTIDEFRSSFDSVEHIDKGIFICKSLVRAYEKKYKL
jgi:hypothetical protein